MKKAIIISLLYAVACGGRADEPYTFVRPPDPWPGPTGAYFLDYSHEEGKAHFGRDPREYGVLPLEYVGDDRGRVRAMRIERLEWERMPDGHWKSHRTGIREDLPADLVFISIGFTGHDTPRIVNDLGVKEESGLIKAEYGRYATNVEKVFVAGDMRRGASLIVWAIAEGRGAARAIDQHLMGHSNLPSPGITTELASSAG